MIAAWCFKRFYKIQLPPYLGFFAGFLPGFFPGFLVLRFAVISSIGIYPVSVSPDLNQMSITAAGGAKEESQGKRKISKKANNTIHEIAQINTNSISWFV